MPRQTGRRYVVVVTSGETPTVMGTFVVPERAEAFRDKVKDKLAPINARGGDYVHCYVVPLDTPTLKNAIQL